MKVLPYEGIVDNGMIRLEEGVQLPVKAGGYVIVPELEPSRVAHVYSPRLAHPAQVKGFRLEVREAPPDAGL